MFAYNIAMTLINLEKFIHHNIFADLQHHLEHLQKFQEIQHHQNFLRDEQNDGFVTSLPDQGLIFKFNLLRASLHLEHGIFMEYI